MTLVLVLVFGMFSTHFARAQTFTVLYNLSGSYTGLVRDAAGNLYGTTPYVGAYGYGSVFKLDTSGTYTVLHSFAGGLTDGCYPWANLILDAAGNLYGTTSNCGPSSSGTVFKVDTSGNEIVLHSFAAGSADGAFPFGGVILDAKGNLYGSTEMGGTADLGTVFRVSPSGRETVLHSFAGSDGAYPYLASLLMRAGNLYGVTENGGASNYGVVFELSKAGTLTVLHSFAGGTDGCTPLGTLVSDAKGNLYGTTQACGNPGWGIVFEVDTSGTETVLHNFSAGTTDGANPWSGVILDGKGNLYGTALAAGAYGYGTVYELNRKGTLTLLHSFNGTSDGQYVSGGLIRDTAGNLYGTTVSGGAATTGTVWELTP